MHPNFSQLTPRWFKRAFVYTGNIDDFRYRFEMDKDNGLLHTAVYTVYCGGQGRAAAGLPLGRPGRGAAEGLAAGAV